MVEVTCVGLLCLLVMGVAYGLESSDKAPVVANCSAIETFDICSVHLHCEWCGAHNVSFPGGVCFHRGQNFTCCAAHDVRSAFCLPDSQVCTPQETCFQEPVETWYGNCTVPQCCGPETPQPCSPICIASDAICCESGLAWWAGHSCCGGAKGFACCDEGAQCCGNSSQVWCCPSDQECNQNGGCNSTS